MEMKTTAVRKLLPDSWGFLCPVHTPDGGPCGLLNHLAQDCQLALRPPAEIELIAAGLRFFCQLTGLLEAAPGGAGCAAAPHGAGQGFFVLNKAKHVSVFLDGHFVGYVRNENAAKLAGLLRRAKVLGAENRRRSQAVCDFLGVRNYGSKAVVDELTSGSGVNGVNSSQGKECPSELLKLASVPNAWNREYLRLAGNAGLVDFFGGEEGGASSSEGASSASSEETPSIPLLGPHTSKEDEQKFVEQLAHLVPYDLEIGYVDREWGHIHEGLFLYCGPCRFVRPVRCVSTGLLEFLGSFEQMFLLVACSEAELIESRKILHDEVVSVIRANNKHLEGVGRGVLVDKCINDVSSKKGSSSSSKKRRKELDNDAGMAVPDVSMQDLLEQTYAEERRKAKQEEVVRVTYTHREIDPIKMLSIVASLTPFQNHNQSPRCMYQCQMLKQTMGTPFINAPHRTDNKVYRVQNPQRPLTKADMYQVGKFDTHPTGFFIIWELELLGIFGLFSNLEIPY